MSLVKYVFNGSTQHVTRLDGLAGAGKPVEDGSKVVIDTGYGLKPFGEGADASWHDEFELGDDGEFDLFVWDGKAKLASLHGRVMDGSEAGELLEQMNVMSADEAIEGGAAVLHIDMVRADPVARGRGYAQRLLKAAVEEFGRRKFIYAQLFSQRVYRSFVSVLKRLPRVATAATAKYGPDEPTMDPDEDFFIENLDAEPVESESTYKGVGFKLQNKRSVHALWGPK